MLIKKIFRYKKERLIQEYIDKELSKTFFIMDPTFFVDGKVSACIVKEMQEKGTIPIISVDRNVFSELINAVKKGSFASCRFRKEITAFLYWCEKNNICLCPFDAIYEQAFACCDNESGNKENDLFQFIFDNIHIEIVIDSFFDENVAFTGKSFIEANDDKMYDFSSPSSDFLFLYSIMLHLVYVLRTESDKDIQFEKVINWYFENALLSIYALTYIVLLFCKEGITPPHHYMDDSRVIAGCKNEAMDLLYMQSLDPSRYPSNIYTWMMATRDKVLKEVFCTACYSNSVSCVDEYFDFMCSSCEERKKMKYLNILKSSFSRHKNLGVNPSNAFTIAKGLADGEEQALLDILK